MILKYFDQVLKSSLRTDTEMCNFLQMITLFFHDSYENLHNFMILCDVNESNIRPLISEVLLKIFSKFALTYQDEIPSYTRTILILQKILHMKNFNTNLREQLEQATVENLPERIPFSCDFVEFKQILTDICPNSELTR